MSDIGDPTFSPDDQRRRRVLGIVAAIVVVGLIVLVAVILSNDDDSSDDTAAPSSTSSVGSTTTSVVESTLPPTTVPSTTSTTSTPSSTPAVTAVPAQCADAGSDPANPEPAAQAVFVAWTRGDTACAAELMTPEAESSLFARDGSGATDVFQGCNEVDEPDPHVDCAFTYEGGATHYRMNFGATTGWTVYDVYQVAD